MRTWSTYNLRIPVGITGIPRWLATLESWRRIAWLTSANGPAGYRRTLAKAEHLQRTGELPAGAVPWRQLKVELGLPE